MSKIIEITVSDIRKSLIARAKAYSKASGVTLPSIGTRAVNDSKFLTRVENPNVGFNIKTYQKLSEWLDAAERDLEAKKAEAQ